MTMLLNTNHGRVPVSLTISFIVLLTVNLFYVTSFTSITILLRLKDEIATSFRTNDSDSVARDATLRQFKCFLNIRSNETAPVLSSRSNLEFPFPFPFNTRMFCNTPTICLRQRRSNTTELSVYSTDIYTFNLSHTCPSSANIRKTSPNVTGMCKTILDNVICAHGMLADSPALGCPQVKNSLPHTNCSNCLWYPIDQTILFVPLYSFQFNVFHFAYTLTTIMDMLSTTPYPNVTLIFRGMPLTSLGAWQNEMLSAVVKSFPTKRVKVDHVAPNDDRLICAHRAIMPGTRGSIDAWPFQTHDRDVIPALSLHLRQSVYTHFGLHSQSFQSVFDRAELPGDCVVYARRGNETRGRRVFIPEIEQQFVNLLYTFDRCVKIVNGSQDVRQQVNDFKSAAVIVGLHGANLVNSLFAPPFATLVEIIPVWWRDHRNCYVNGGQAALKYKRVEILGGSPLKNCMRRVGRGSGGRFMACDKDVSGSGIIDNVAKSEFTAIANAIRQGLASSDSLKQKFRRLGYIPLAHSPDAAEYHVTM